MMDGNLYLMKNGILLHLYKNINPKEEAPQTTFEPVSNFGEKRVLPITKQTVVMVKKVD